MNLTIKILEYYYKSGMGKDNNSLTRVFSIRLYIYSSQGFHPVHRL